MAAITASNLTQADSGAASSWNTASITPTANNLVLVSVITVSSGTPRKISSVSGCGLTWVEVANRQSVTNTAIWLTVFRAMGSSPSTGALTITAAGSMFGAAWSVDQFANVVTTGSNGANAIIQSNLSDASGTQTGTTNTLASGLSSSTNAVYGYVNWGGGSAVTSGASYTQLAATTGSVFGSQNSEWAINKSAPNWTWASASNWSMSAAIEIASPTTSSPLFFSHL